MGIEWVFLIFIALFCAWYLGFLTKQRSYAGQRYDLPRDYLVGLNYLLNEEADKAVDIFVKMLEVDSGTVETHLAVAKLFRKRGEVDRAIRIHQNLIARPQLDKAYREQSLFELGQDYLSVGVLDRAERIFLEVIGLKQYSIPALKSLLSIYQQEKDWMNAIKIAKQLAEANHKNMDTEIAHFYCELAELNTTKNKADAVIYLKKALEFDSKCARASLLQAKLSMNNDDFKHALKCLKRIKDQNPEYLSEAIDPLASCYEGLKQEEKLVAYLMQLLNEYPKLPVVLILSERIRKWKGDKVAANFVADYTRRYPSIAGLHLFINLYLSNTEGRAKDDLLILQGLTGKLLADKPDYRCVSCGFSGKNLHWQCPGCKQWASIKPIQSLEH
jgi:lipopolysaccharide biosynthesis regulator YciM